MLVRGTRSLTVKRRQDEKKKGQSGDQQFARAEVTILYPLRKNYPKARNGTVGSAWWDGGGFLFGKAFWWVGSRIIGRSRNVLLACLSQWNGFTGLSRMVLV